MHASNPTYRKYARLVGRIVHHKDTGEQFAVEKLEEQEGQIVALATSPDTYGRSGVCKMIPAQVLRLEIAPAAAE